MRCPFTHEHLGVLAEKQECLLRVHMLACIRLRPQDVWYHPPVVYINLYQVREVLGLQIISTTGGVWTTSDIAT